jgi:DNA-binding LacI/PurR family transcriptional regulator
MGAKVTIQDIAREAGVSIATVSRVLSQKGPFKSDTADLVLAAARKLGYHRAGYLAPGAGQVRNVALVTPPFVGEFISELYHGFYAAGMEAGFKVTLVYQDPGSEELLDQVLALFQQHDALCLFLPTLGEEDYRAIRARAPRSPLISIAPISNPVLETVTFDSYGGGDLVARHFQEQGFRQVGIINGSSNAVEALLRRGGFIDRVNRTAELECVWEFDGDYSFASGQRAYHDLKSRGAGPVAVFGANDEMCFGFLSEAGQDGAVFPDQLALAGFDDVNLTRLVTPSLTSIATDFSRMGRVALRQLARKFTAGGEEDGHLTMIPVSLAVRRSTRRG